MKKLIIPFLLVMALAFQACEETQSPIYDGSQTLAYFDGTSANLEVIINQTGEITVPVGVSTLSSTDRTVSVSAAASSTATAGQYSFNGSVTIPANSYSGSFTVTGIDDGLTTDGVSLDLQIDGVDGGVGSPRTYAITILEICPIDATAFVGDYQLQFITPGIFNLGAFGNDGDILTLAVGSSSTERTFDSFYLGDSRFPRTFTFGLSCNTTTFALFDTNVTCDTSDDINLVLGPPAAGAEGSYISGTDDSSFTINVTDNVDSDCGGSPSQSSYRFVKQ